MSRRYSLWLLYQNFLSKLLAKPRSLSLNSKTLTQYEFCLVIIIFLLKLPLTLASGFCSLPPPFSVSLFGNFLWNIMVLEGDPVFIPINYPQQGLGASLSLIMIHFSSKLHSLRELGRGSGDHIGWADRLTSHSHSVFSRCLNVLLALRLEKTDLEVPLTTWWLYF